MEETDVKLPPRLIELVTPSGFAFKYGDHSAELTYLSPVDGKTPLMQFEFIHEEDQFPRDAFIDFMAKFNLNNLNLPIDEIHWSKGPPTEALKTLEMMLEGALKASALANIRYMMVSTRVFILDEELWGSARPTEQ